MTTEVTITLSHNPHDKKVEIHSVDAGGGNAALVGVLDQVGQEFRQPVYNGRSFMVREVDADPVQEASPAAQDAPSGD